MDWRRKVDDEGRRLVEFIKEENNSIICVACNKWIMSKNDAFGNIEKHIRTIEHGAKLYLMINGKSPSAEIIDLTNSDASDTDDLPGADLQNSRKRNNGSLTQETSKQVEDESELKRKRLVQKNLDWKVVKNADSINKTLNKHNLNQSRQSVAVKEEYLPRPTPSSVSVKQEHLSKSSTSVSVKQEDKSSYNNFDRNRFNQVQGSKINNFVSTTPSVVFKQEDRSRPAPSSVSIKQEHLSRPSTSVSVKQEDKSSYNNFDRNRFNQSTTQEEGSKINNFVSTTPSVVFKQEDRSRPTTSFVITEQENRPRPTTSSVIIEQENYSRPTTSSDIFGRNNYDVGNYNSSLAEERIFSQSQKFQRRIEEKPNTSNVPLRPGKKNKRKFVDEGEEPDEEGEIGISDTYADYEPIKLKIGAAHPYPVVESSSLSSVMPPDINYQLSIPEKVITDGLLSALQLESVVYASQAHMKHLPDGSRAGFFIGDGAGVGKGRTIAGIILENYMLKRRKALWVSYSSDLQKDAERDLADISASHIKTYLINQFKYNKIAIKEGILFSTYQSLIAGTKSKINRFKTHLQQIIDFLGKDFDGCIVFDECHKAKNLIAESTKKPTKTGKIVLELQEALPNARVVYSSATGASTPRNMAYMVRLGIWGTDTPFTTFKDFMSVVEKRGVGTMEIIAMDMKLRGMYIARQLSFRGVKFDINEVPFPNKFQEAYDRSVDLWVEAKHLFEQASNLIDSSSSPVGERSVWMQFWRAHQRFFQYFCIAAKVEKLAELAMDAVKNGKCVVIGLQLTGEGPTTQYRRHHNNISEFISAAQICFESLIESQFPTMKQAVKRRNTKSTIPSKKQRLDLDDSDFESADEVSENDDIDSDVDLEFEDEDDIPLSSRIELAKSENDDQNKGKILLEMKKSLLQKIENLGPYLPPNTLDHLIHCLGGTENVAEMTGRKGRIVQNSAGRVIYESRKEQEISMESVNLTERERFMNGNKLIAIISEAASNGISLHSDRRVKNQRQRVHYTLELPWSADKAIQQFGRTHRSNQVNSPECVILISNLAGERRFASVIAKRLETLGALLHGDRRASESRDLSQFNIDTNYGKDALENVLLSIVNERPMTHVPPPPLDYTRDFYKDIQNALIGVGLIIERKSSTSLLLDLATDSKEQAERSLQLSNGYRKIPTFLNRILGTKVEIQNRLFQYFTDTLSACITYAKKMGTYDKGILDLGSGDESVTRINTIRFTRPLENGVAVIDLQKFHIVRGMDFDKACSINSELTNKIEGFYLSDSGGKRTAILVALNEARGRDGIRVYRPHIAATNEYFTDIKFKFTKVAPQVAQYHWEYQFKSSLDTCRHAFLNGNCKNVTIGIGCEFGLRKRTYGVLSGAVLSTWNTVEQVLVGNTNRKIQVIRIKVDENDKIFGTLVPNDRYELIRKVLEESFETVQVINH